MIFIYHQICKDLNLQYIPGKTCVAWVVAGGSYAGAVSAWLMQQHPGLFAGAISSSGVVDARFEIPEFDTQTYAAAGQPCAQAFVQAMRDIEHNQESFMEYFGTTGKNEQDFYYFLADASLMVFQYGDWAKLCPKLISAYKLSQNVTPIFAEYMKNNFKFDSYDREYLKNSPRDGHQRQWWYQTCTEVAYFQPAPLINNIRSQKVTTQWHLDICKYAFDLELNDPTERTNQYYGVKEVYGPDTIFTNFWQDIWHIIGVIKQSQNQPNVEYIHCRDCAHCVDLHTIKESDPTELKQLRQNVIDFISNRFDNWDKSE
ncbi:Serine_peptidase [Hexamita inflata]|uniref:Serine_peptidase n=1 Tax=Hexamita inflata TaxID=28002 RepID=A0ABP1IK18_9EUKA